VREKGAEYSCLAKTKPDQPRQSSALVFARAGSESIGNSTQLRCGEIASPTRNAVHYEGVGADFVEPRAGYPPPGLPFEAMGSFRGKASAK
jgi:hypothetical protein